MDALETIKVSSRGQIVIPEEVRKDLGIGEGSKLILIEDNGKIILEKEEEFLKRLRSKEKDGENEFYRKMFFESTRKAWDNPKDDEAAKWYGKQVR